MNWEPILQNLPNLINSFSLVVIAFCFRKMANNLNDRITLLSNQISHLHTVCFEKWIIATQDGEKLSPLELMLRDRKAQQQ